MGNTLKTLFIFILLCSPVHADEYIKLSDSASSLSNALAGYFLKLDQTVPQTTVGTFTFPTVNFGTTTGARATATNGVLTLTGLKSGGFNEDMTFDFETTTNQVRISSTTGALFNFLKDVQVPDNIQFAFGSGTDSMLRFTTTGNDCIQFGMVVNAVDDSGYLCVVEKADLGVANRSPLVVSPDPVLRVYSADAAVATDYIEMFHNQTTAVVRSGDGAISFAADNLVTTGTLGAGATTVSSLFSTGMGTFGDTGGVYNYAVGAGVGTLGFNSTGGGYVAGVDGYGALMQMNNTTGAFAMFLESNVLAGVAHGHTTTLSWDSTGAVTIPVGLTSVSYTIGANTLTTSEWAFLDGQDQAVATTSSPTFAAGTFNGALTMGDPTLLSIFATRGAAGTNRDWRFYSGTAVSGNLRWTMRVNSAAETGSNAGSNFVLFTSDDAGATLQSNLTITRSSGAWSVAFPTNIDVAFSPIAITARQNITATAARNFIGLQVTQNEVISATFSNTGTVPTFFAQNLRANTAGAGDGGTLTSQYGHNLNVGHTSSDKYVNPLTTTVAGSGTTLNITRGTITNSYALLGASNNALAVPSTWVANTVYAVTDRVKPTVANGYYYACSTAGTSHLTTEPIWPATSVAGGTPATIVDNTVTWTEIIVPAITNERGVYISSTTAANYFGGNLGIGQSLLVGTSARLVIGNTAWSQTAWGVNGCRINVAAQTTTDTASSGTVATAVASAFGIPTFAASSATTFTNAATVYIAGVPAVGTNVTLTKAWGLWLDAGDARFDGNMTVGATALATPVGTLDVFETTGATLSIGRNDASVTAADVVATINFPTNDTSTTTNKNAAQIQITAKNTISTDINPGVIKFYTTGTGVAGALTLALTLDETQATTFAGAAVASTVIRLKSYTVATLPAGTQGDTAFVTDALGPTFLVAVVGGGAVITPVFYNGAAWVSY